MEPILIVLGIILVIVIGGGLWLYAGRRRGRVSDEISAHQPMSVEDLLPSQDEGTDEEAEGEGTAEPAATLESPESIPGCWGLRSWEPSPWETATMTSSF